MDILAFIAAMSFIILIGVIILMIHLSNEREYREREMMLKRGFVPKGYQPIDPQAQPQTQASQPNMQPTYPRYELPQLPEQGAPMPFSNEQAKAQPATLYDMPTASISPAGKRK